MGILLGVWLNPEAYAIRDNTVRNFDFGFGLPGGSGSISEMAYENVTVEIQKGYDDKAWTIY